MSVSAAATLYKVLDTDGRPYHGGTGDGWALPNGQPGAWQTVRGQLVPCRNGLHLCRRGDLVHWLGPAIFVAEADTSEMIDHGDKVVVRKARLVAQLDAWDDKPRHPLYVRADTLPLPFAHCPPQAAWTIGVS